MKSSESACVFLRCGRTNACLRLRGTIPDERERFVIFVIVGNSEPTTSFNSLIGIMSSSQVEFLAAFITLSNSSSVNSSKAGNLSHQYGGRLRINFLPNYFFSYFGCKVCTECPC